MVLISVEDAPHLSLFLPVSKSRALPFDREAEIGMVILCGTARSPGHCLGATTAAWPLLTDRLDNLPLAKHLLLCVEIKIKGNASFLIRGMQVCMSTICLGNERGHDQIEQRLPKYTPCPHPLIQLSHTLKLILDDHLYPLHFKAFRGSSTASFSPARKDIRDGTLGQEGDLSANVVPASNWLCNFKQVPSPL